MKSSAVRQSVLFALTLTLANCQLFNLGKDGNVGVNFGGYHASAGLGGLLTGDVAKGGLHAEAGTPFGQAAGAGLGGGVGNDGVSKGGLYAGATAGGGVSAGAELSGTAAKGASVGVAGTAASAGGVSVVKTVEAAPAVAVAPVAAFQFEKRFQPIQPSVYLEKHIETAPVQPVVVEEVAAAPVVTKYVAAAPVVTEYIVPKYRVHVRRPHHFRKHAYFTAAYNAGNEAVVPAPQTVKVVETVKSAPAPVVQVQKTVVPAPVVVHKYVAPAPVVKGGLLTRLFLGAAAPAAATPAVASGEVVKQYPATYGYGATATIAKNGNLFNDIFNIPISTLGAVNQLVNGIVGGTSVAVSKNVAVGGQGYAAVG